MDNLTINLYCQPTPRMGGKVGAVVKVQTDEAGQVQSDEAGNILQPDAPIQGDLGTY